MVGWMDKNCRLAWDERRGIVYFSRKTVLMTSCLSRGRVFLHLKRDSLERGWNMEILVVTSRV